MDSHDYFAFLQNKRCIQKSLNSLACGLQETISAALISMSTSNGFRFDMTKIKEENMDIGASIKAENFTSKYKSTDLKLKLLCINEDIIDYEEREATSVKIKTESGDYPDTETDAHKQTRVESEVEQKNKTNDPWTPVGMSKLVDHFEGNLNINRAPQIDIKNTKEKTTTVHDKRTTRMESAGRNSARNTECSSEWKEDGKCKPKGNPSHVFKDPNKVLDPNSYIYSKKSNGREMNHGQNNHYSRSTASCDPSNSKPSANTIRQRMEKKYLSFVNKTTKQRRESYLIYFNDFGLEAILVSHKSSDKTELYTKRDDPNTFYRLFYNFVKAKETNPKPTIRAIEVEVIAKEIATINAKITESAEKENEEVPFKKPRLTTNNHRSDLTKNLDTGIVRSARKLVKMRKESETRDSSKTSEHNKDTFRPSPSNRYWEHRGRKYLCKDEC